MAASIPPELVDAYLSRHQSKELLRFVAVGSVDDGKSTLIGRLLHDSHGIYDDQLAAVQRASVKRGSAGNKLDLALLTDGLRAEREQGITIDVAYRYFSTDKRKFIIADTPGHVQYTRNMATGASTANVALILIDARHGVLQQSRRHATIGSLLGIPHLLVCVNKMDLCDFRQEIFESIKRDFESFSEGLGFKDVRFVPISAVDGDNVVHASTRTPWYGGETVLGYLETVPIEAAASVNAFRFPVQYVLRPNLKYRGFCGQISSGVIRRGDDVMVLPSGYRSQVAAIDSYEGELKEAFAPMSVTLRLIDEIDVSRGDMIVHSGYEPTVARCFEAHVVWMSERALDPGASYYLKHTTRTVRANVDAVLSRLDLEVLEELSAPTLQLNDIGRLAISTNQPLYFDAYARNRQLGAFVLVDTLTNNTVAAGMIIRALDEGRRGDGANDKSRVDPIRRQQRLGHGPAVITFAGQPAAGQRRVALAIEMRLFELGCVVALVDCELQDGTRSPALIADLAAQCVSAGAIAVLSSAPPRAADRQQLRERLGPLLVILDAGPPDQVRGASDPGAVVSVALDQPGNAANAVVDALVRCGVMVAATPIPE